MSWRAGAAYERTVSSDNAGSSTLRSNRRICRLGCIVLAISPEAAHRGEKLTLDVHCRQVAVVTREIFGEVKKLGTVEPDSAEAA